MRGRLVAIMIALALLALAEIRDQRDQIAERQGTAVLDQLAGSPAPEADVAVVITAAVGTSATVQTTPVVEPTRHPLLSRNLFTPSSRPPVVAHSTHEPRFFPLLI